MGAALMFELLEEDAKDRPISVTSFIRFGRVPGYIVAVTHRIGARMCVMLSDAPHGVNERARCIPSG
jgi:hypothetical protein